MLNENDDKDLFGLELVETSTDLLESYDNCILADSEEEMPNDSLPAQ